MSETIEPNDQGKEIEEAEILEETLEEEAATSEEVETEESKETEESEKENGVQKRINELTRLRYEEKEARAKAEEQARLYQQQLNELQVRQSQSQWQNGEPKIEDFNYDHEQWSNAYRQWVSEGIQQRQQAEKQAIEYQQQQQAAYEKQMVLQRKIAEAKSKYHDFDDKVNNPELPSLASLNRAAHEALLESDSMADVAYYLASNPAEVYKFKELSPIQAIKEVARLESKLAQKAAEVTQAPKPPESTGGSKRETMKKPPTDMEEYVKWRRAQLER